MLLNVVVKVVEGLDLLQVLYRDGDFVVELHQCDEVYEVNTVEAEGLFQVSIGCELTLFNFKLFSQQAVYLCDNFFSCHDNLQFYKLLYYFLFTVYFPISAVFDDQRRVGTTKSERVAQEDVEVLLTSLGNDVDALSNLIRILEVDRTGNEVVLHHQHRVDNL